MFLKQSTVYTRTFFIVSSSDHLSAKTGAAPVVNISKAGGAFGAAGGAVTEIANGWYKVALSTTDTNTLGDLAYHITGTGADDTDFADSVSVNSLDDLSTLTAAGIRSAIGLASANLDTQLTTIDDFLDTEIAAIKAKTDQLTFTVANKVDSTIQLASDFAQGAADKVWSSAARTLTSLSGVAADIRAAIGLASANLDTQLSTIAGYIDTEIGTLVANVATILAAVDTEVGAIKAKTDNLPASPAATSDIPTAAAISSQIQSDATTTPLKSDIKKINGTTVTGNGTSGTPWGP